MMITEKKEKRKKQNQVEKKPPNETERKIKFFLGNGFYNFVELKWFGEH